MGIRFRMNRQYASEKGFAFEFNYKWSHTVCEKGIYETSFPGEDDEVAASPYKYLPDLEARSNFGALQKLLNQHIPQIGSQSKMLSLFILMTYCHRAFNFLPYLWWIQSSKSSDPYATQVILEALCFRPRIRSRIPERENRRDIAETGDTFILDLQNQTRLIDDLKPITRYNAFTNHSNRHTNPFYPVIVNSFTPPDQQLIPYSLRIFVQGPISYFRPSETKRAHRLIETMLYTVQNYSAIREAYQQLEEDESISYFYKPLQAILNVLLETGEVSEDDYKDLSSQFEHLSNGCMDFIDPDEEILLQLKRYTDSKTPDKDGGYDLTSLLLELQSSCAFTQEMNTRALSQFLGRHDLIMSKHRPRVKSQLQRTHVVLNSKRLQDIQ